MPNKHLKNKIRKYELYKSLLLSILIFCAYLAGRYFFFQGLLNFFVGFVLGIIGAILLFIIERYIDKQYPYKKGLKLEEQIAKKLEALNIEYKWHEEVAYGDLDFLIKRDGVYYGVEVKNWAGSVIFKDGLLKVDGWDNTIVLSKLLGHCKLVRNKKFGEDSKKFIKPVLVFGHKAVVNIPQNKVIFNNREIIVATIKDLNDILNK